jgi:hypothetical protein
MPGNLRAFGVGEDLRYDRKPARFERGNGLRYCHNPSGAKKLPANALAMGIEQKHSQDKLAYRDRISLKVGNTLGS